MDYGEAYVKSIAELKREISRLNSEIKKMREHKKLMQLSLYDWMNRNNLDEYNGIKKIKLLPKDPLPKKKLSQKKEDAIKLFRNAGIPDPESFYVEYQRTQKILLNELNNN